MCSMLVKFAASIWGRLLWELNYGLLRTELRLNYEIAVRVEITFIAMTNEGSIVQYGTVWSIGTVPGSRGWASATGVFQS